MHNFKELKVWQKAVELATHIYEATKNFPKDEKFGLTSQIRRSVVSISSNIAEGAGRNSNKEFKLFLNYAYGSCSELETQLIISKNLDFLNTDSLSILSDSINEIQKMIFSLSNTMN